ncbi:MAG TPA: flagellar basal-body MS-ring/collar protein FliF [Pilimelia sp.]|nr:flagellar basal-body MS-ring/collar protein FliF [Pilimelia sp.]
MADRIPAPLRKLGDAFRSFTPGQKAVTLLGIVALVVGGFFFANWASTPTYAPLFSNLSGADANAIVEELGAGGTPYQLADGGATVLVPKDQVYDLRLKMSGAGLPAQAESGYSLLDKQGVTTSDFMQQVGYQRALEGELAKTIKSIQGVQAATVHLVIPKKDIFSDDERKPSASVLVATGAGRELGHEQVQAIVHLVASSVEGLEPEQVTLAGADGKVLSTGDGAAGLAAAGGDARAQQTAQFEQRMNLALQRMLENVVGAGKAVVKTTADLDFDATETKTQRYVADANVPPLSETTKRETYNGTGNGAGGVLGPDNVQAPNGGGTGQYESTSEARQNAVGMVTETRKSAPGNVRRLNVAVLIDATTAQGIDNAQIQQMISAAVGLNAERGDTMAVTALPFDTRGADEAKEALAKADADAQREQYLNWGKTGAMVLAILILLFLAWRAKRRAAKRTGLTPEELAELEAARQALEEARARQALDGPPTAMALEAAGRDNDDADRDARHRDIAEMVANQPEDVAQLLRTWLADRRS